MVLLPKRTKRFSASLKKIPEIPPNIPEKEAGRPGVSGPGPPGLQGGDLRRFFIWSFQTQDYVKAEGKAGQDLSPGQTITGEKQEQLRDIEGMDATGPGSEEEMIGHARPRPARSARSRHL